MLTTQLNVSHPIGMAKRQGMNGFEYERRVSARWAVQAGEADSEIQDNGHSYIEILNNYSVLLEQPPVPSDVSFRLRPITDFMSIIENKDVLVNYIKFYSVYTQSKGGAGYTADIVNQLIENSLSSSNFAYNQAGLRYTSFSHHQPNYFNPRFIINGVDLFLGSSNSSPNSPGGTANRGKLSIGMELPMEVSPNQIFENVQSIEVFGQCLQELNMTPTEQADTYRYQRYPVFCEADLLILKEN